MSENLQVLYGEEESAELIREFDVDTGIEVDESIDGVVSHESRQAISESQALSEMKKSHGWAIVNEFLETYISGWTEKLVLAKDYDEIRRIQESIQAMSSVLGFIESKIIEGQKFSEDQK